MLEPKPGFKLPCRPFRSLYFVLASQHDEECPLILILDVDAGRFGQFFSESSIHRAAAQAQIKEWPRRLRFSLKRQHPCCCSRGFAPDTPSLEQSDLEPRLRQPPGDRAPNHSAADHDHVSRHRIVMLALRA